MKKEDLKIFEESDWLFLRLKSNHHYKGKIIRLSDDCVTIKDRFGEILVLDLVALDFVKKWAEKREESDANGN